MISGNLISSSTSTHSQFRRIFQCSFWDSLWQEWNSSACMEYKAQWLCRQNYSGCLSAFCPHFTELLLPFHKVTELTATFVLAWARAAIMIKETPPKEGFSHKAEVSGRWISPLVVNYIMHTSWRVVLICFCFVVFSLFVHLFVCHMDLVEQDTAWRQKKEKETELLCKGSTEPERARRSVLFFEASQPPSSWSTSSTPESLWDFSFGWASSCIFLLVAIGTALTNSGKAQK